MACRCYDIGRAEREVRRMEDARDDICDILREFDLIEQDYMLMLSKERLSYHLEEVDFNCIDQVIDSENTSIKDRLLRYKETINNGIVKLYNKIRNMEREDERYHSEDED